MRKDASMNLNNMKSREEITESKESKLTRMFAEINAAKESGKGDRLVCETQCTMARIRSLSDFLYLMRVKPLQTACYYGAAVFFLLTVAAVWCTIGKDFDDPRNVWYLIVIFGIIFFILATLPHNMRISYFNKQADALERSYGKIINAEFTDKDIILSVSDSIPEEQQLDEEGNAVARRSALSKDEKSTVVVHIPYENIPLAYECSHSFYIFPVDENKKGMDTIICDKTQFLCGTPMGLRDRLARGCGKRFKIKAKKA